MKIYQGEGAFEIITPQEVLSAYLLTIEKAGRTCYQTESGPITYSTANKFVAMIMSRRHFSVLEHGLLTVKFFNVSRGFTHELVRHRLASFSQESTRFVDYIKGDKHPDLERFQCEFVLPPHCNPEQEIVLSDGTKITPKTMLQNIENYYRALRNSRWPTDDARQILPNALTSDIVVSANLREWRHIFFMRTAKPAHWEIRNVMGRLLLELQKNIPVIFEDFEYAGSDENDLAYYTCKYDDNH